MLLGQQIKILWANAPQNYSNTASTDLYVSLKKYGRLAVIITTGAWAGGTAAVTLKQATTQAGAGAKALNFDTMWTDAGGTQGTLVRTAVVSNTFNLSTANSCWLVEVDARTLDLANGFAYAAVDVASPGANADFWSAVYVLGEPLYEQDALPSVLI